MAIDHFFFLQNKFCQVFASGVSPELTARRLWKQKVREACPLFKIHCNFHALYRLLPNIFKRRTLLKMQSDAPTSDGRQLTLNVRKRPHIAHVMITV